jgi:hypothetical protein
MRLISAMAVSLLLFLATSARADTPPAGAGDYLEGLTAFELAKYDDAIAAMSKAIEMAECMDAPAVTDDEFAVAPDGSVAEVVAARAFFSKAKSCWPPARRPRRGAG